MLDTLAQSAVNLCEADQAVIRRRVGDSYPVAATCGFTQQQREHLERYSPKPGRGSVFGRTIVEGRTVHIPDVSADPEWERADQPRVTGIRAAVGVPLLREGVIVGILVVIRTEPRAFSQKQIELLEIFADQAVIAIENVRLFEEVQQRTRELSVSLEQQTATSEILQTINESPGDLTPVFDTMVESAMRLCQADYGHVYSYDGKLLHLVAAHGEPRYVNWIKENGPRTPGGSLTFTRILGGEPLVHLADISQDASYRTGNQRAKTIVDQFGIHTLLTVPLRKEETLLGGFVLYRVEAKPFSDKQISLVQNFAAQAVIAMENTRLLNELRESLQQQTATSDVLGVISRSAFDLQPIFETVAESAVRLCGADKAFILRLDGELLHVVVARNASPELAEFMRQNPIRPGRGSTAGRAALERRTTQIADVMADPEYTYGSKAIDPLRTVLAVPMVKGDELLGVILTYRLEVKPFSEKQIALVETFADQAVIAIENVRLFEEVKKRTEELTESLQQQTATADVLKVISRSAFHLQSVLDTLLNSAARLCQADHSFIFLREGDVYRCAAGSGEIPEWIDYLKQQTIRPGRGTIAARTALEGRTVHIPDVLADPEYTFLEAQKRGGYRTALGVPLLREGVSIGVIVLTRPTVRPFDTSHIALVTTFADQAVIAIENVRLFESVEARTRELAASFEELRTTQDRLVQTQKLALLGQLTAGIAHEIKNPLNFVNNFSGISAELIGELQDTLKGMPLDDKTRTEINELTDTLKSNFDKVVHHGRRADAIVKNMLQHSREGSGEHRVIDINALVEESLNLAWHGARAETQGFEVKLKQSFDPSAGGADVFPQDIRRALLNLIANGFYAATRRRAETNGADYEPTFTASTKNLGDRVEVRIRDNGTGMTPDVKEKMFNPFFTTKPTGEGTGLGLSISHDVIVKQHAGTIEVDTQPGEFTEIRIVLPRTPAFV